MIRAFLPGSRPFSILIAAVLLAAVLLPVSAQNRLVLGGKAVVMVADALYFFRDADARVLAVAGADQGMGVFLSSIDPGFSKKPVIDRNAGAEVYASLRPDAIVLKSSMKKSLGPSLDALGLKQFYLDLETPEDYLSDLHALGKFLGQEFRASEVIEFYQGRMNEVNAAVNGVQRPRVLLVQAADAVAGVWEVPPASWMQTRMVSLAGGDVLWTAANPGAGWAKVNAEQIAAWNPEVIFVVDYRKDARQAARSLREDARLRSVEAVKSGKVYGFAQDFLSWDQPDARWILGLEWMAGKLHPGQFSGKPILDSARRFFSFLYGVDAATFDRVILPRLGGDLSR
jgi:iron complex transport system substrate-binding protein